MFQKSALLIVCCAMIFCSCTSSKKLKASQAEAAQLTTMNNDLKTANSDLTTKNNDLQKQVTDMTSSTEAARQEFEKYKTDCESTKEHLKMVESALAELYTNLQDVEKTIEKGMIDFAGKGVNVYYKDGLVYIDMQDNLLYKSGSSTLGAEGKKALSAVAAALNEYPKLRVIVVGNTDDKQYKNGSDNWSLSTERANGVVRILSKDYKVDPTRLTAAGRAKYHPVADNSTNEGRAKNRHTEIILNPDLDKIWESVQKQ
ncbi:MAG TPA: OmpA family protein [Flavitalea sp.]|nr:OmpA family protein [Flavitalea sp.]